MLHHIPADHIVKKIQNSSDKRKYNLILTETGLKIAITIEKIMDNYLDEISKLFFKDEKERKKIAEAGLKRCQTSDYSNEGMIKNVLNSIFQTIK